MENTDACACGMGWKNDKFNAVLGKGPREGIKLPGYIDYEDLPALYSSAAVFAFPSKYEGFGCLLLRPVPVAQ